MRVTDLTRVHLVAFLGGKLTEFDLVPGEVVLGESDRPVQLLYTCRRGKLVVRVDFLRSQHLFRFLTSVIVARRFAAIRGVRVVLRHRDEVVLARLEEAPLIIADNRIFRCIPLHEQLWVVVVVV